MDVILDPFAWWIEPFQDEAVWRGLLAGILVIICASTIGSWVVIRGMTYFADALAHGVLPGIAIAMTLNWNPTLGASIAALLMITGIRGVRRFSPLPNDVSIGILFVGMLALTVVMVGQHGEEELHEILFGSILSVTNGDLILLAVAAGVIATGMLVFYRIFLTTTFDPLLARTLRLRPNAAEFILLILLSLSIIASFKAVGGLLVFALLIAPPATAAIIFQKTSMIMLAAMVQGLVSVYLGILIGFHKDVSLSGAIGLVSVIIFLVALIVRGVVGYIKARPLGTKPPINQATA